MLNELDDVKTAWKRRGTNHYAFFLSFNRIKNTFRLSVIKPGTTNYPLKWTAWVILVQFGERSFVGTSKKKSRPGSLEAD